jgi:hypothetical protein
MKKLSMVALMVAISAVSFAQMDAQRTITASKPIDEKLTPHQVIDTLKKHFPNAESVQYYETSSAAAKGWTVSDDNANYGEQSEFYTIKFKRDDFTYYALFQADGTLIKSEFQQKDVELPEAVVTSLQKLKAEKYPDYQLLTKDYFKYENYDMHKDYYKITAVKTSDNTQKKVVTVDAAGNIISVK